MYDIREATAHEAAVISKIHAETWRHAYRGMVPERFLNELADDAWVPMFRDTASDRQVYLAYRDGQAVGAASFGNARDAGLETLGEIYSIYVLPDKAGKGCGKALMQAILDRMKAHGHQGVYLYCLKPNVASHRFYEHCGFTYVEDGDKPLEMDGETLVTVQFRLLF